MVMFSIIGLCMILLLLLYKPKLLKFLIICFFLRIILNYMLTVLFTYQN